MPAPFFYCQHPPRFGTHLVHNLAQNWSGVRFGSNDFKGLWASVQVPASPPSEIKPTVSAVGFCFFGFRSLEGIPHRQGQFGVFDIEFITEFFSSTIVD